MDKKLIKNKAMNKEIEKEIKAKKQAKEFVEKWMKTHEPDTFIPNKHGAYIYTSGCSSINIVCFFEDLLEDFINEKKLKTN